jgi:hypothetical protein
MTAQATTVSKPRKGAPAGKWRGATREYDLAKEFTIALVIVGLVTMVLAAIFSSPDEKNLTLQSWAQTSPDDFYATTVEELAGTSASATYGPPYNSNGDGQAIGPLTLAKWGGVHVTVDPANDFVIKPLTTQKQDAAVGTALAQWKGASADQQTKWATDYSDALTAVGNDTTKVAGGDYGPVPALAKGLLAMAASGALESQLVDGGSGFFQLNYTKPILFLGDGTYLEDQATQQHLTGRQWGMMNETGNYPGQAWLWLYTFWYQVNPFADEKTTLGANADAWVWGIMMVLTLLLALVPFIPGLRSIPRWIPIHKLIWRDYYRRYGTGANMGGHDTV